MKKKLISSTFVVITLLSPIISCQEKNFNETTAPHSEVLTDKRVTSNALDIGITQFDIAARTSGETAFKLTADSVNINGKMFNLSGKQVEFENTNSKFQLSISLFENDYTLNIDSGKKKSILNVNGINIDITDKSIRALNNDDNLAFIVLLCILNDRTSHSTERISRSELNSAKKPVSYITMSAGLSQSSAGSNLDSYNANQETVLTTHGCVRSGRDFGCVVGATICVAMDHWNCDSDPGFNIS